MSVAIRDGFRIAAMRQEALALAAVGITLASCPFCQKLVFLGKTVPIDPSHHAVLEFTMLCMAHMMGCCDTQQFVNNEFFDGWEKVKARPHRCPAEQPR